MACIPAGDLVARLLTRLSTTRDSIALAFEAFSIPPTVRPNGLSAPSVLTIPLGGLGEFGMNMMAFRSGDDIIVIDAGLMFPESELLGVDVVLPDISYLKQHRAMVRGIVLTHGHEDHIGALQYILRDLNVPVYGTRFTLALVKKRIEEAGLLG